MERTGISQIAKVGSFIGLNAVHGHAKTLAGLLTGGAEMVRKSEPQTLQWLALQEEPGRYAIADFYPDPEGRQAHFAGMVAEALKKIASETVEGGWESGVLARVENPDVLSSAISDSHYSEATQAMRMDFRAKPGKESELARLLTGAAAIIEGTEPGTLLWYALRFAPERFAIFDVFPNDSARNAHLKGKVAASLKSKAEEWVVGGWNVGVMANVRHFHILSCTY